MKNMSTTIPITQTPFDVFMTCQSMPVSAKDRKSSRPEVQQTGSLTEHVEVEVPVGDSRLAHRDARVARRVGRHLRTRDLQLPVLRQEAVPAPSHEQRLV